MANNRNYNAFEEVFTPKPGSHKVHIEFEAGFHTKQDSDGNIRTIAGLVDGNGNPVPEQFQWVTFYDVENKTYWVKELSSGQKRYLFAGFGKLEALWGVPFSKIPAYLAKNDVEVFTSVHPQYGLQVSAFAPKNS